MSVDWAWALQRVQHAASIESLPTTRERLERARSFLHAHATDAVDLDRVAKEAAFSRFHFQREFAKAFGRTPHQYLMQRRLEKAKQLLLGDASVTEVCFAVGYESVGSFSTTFRKHVGVAPSRYRKRIFPSADLQVPRIPACFLRYFAPSPG